MTNEQLRDLTPSLEQLKRWELAIEAAFDEFWDDDYRQSLEEIRDLITKLEVGE